jgi:hypothetical protein
MSQFLLAQGVDASLLPKSTKLIPVSNDEFLSNVAEQIFGAEVLADVVTVVSDGEDFDAVLVRAQLEVSEGKDYTNTALNALLMALTKAAKRVALWYGNDYVDLEPVCDAQVLSRIVRDGLSLPSVEVYALFLRQ